jgi:dihydroorotate dehydrogenase
LIENLLER